MALPLVRDLDGWPAWLDRYRRIVAAHPVRDEIVVAEITGPATPLLDLLCEDCRAKVEATA